MSKSSNATTVSLKMVKILCLKRKSFEGGELMKKWPSSCFVLLLGSWIPLITGSLSEFIDTWEIENVQKDIWLSSSVKEKD